jgi:hypothetical protein
VGTEDGDEGVPRREPADPELLAYMDELRRKIAEDEALGGSSMPKPPTMGRMLAGTAATTGVLAAIAAVIVLALVVYIIMTTGPR